MELTLHPNVYSTGRSKGLVNLLERVWVREHTPGDGTIFVMSGFGNYNGGVRFFETFKKHKEQGGSLVAIFAGSSRARLTSKQLIRELLECGAEVHVVNRKRLLHMKCYGAVSDRGQSLVVTSGNFTGPGMSQNVEISVLLGAQQTAEMSFSWHDMVDSVLNQKWALYRPTLDNLTAPAWQLLYDEQGGSVIMEDTDKMTMILLLGHADTVRVQASPGSVEGRGSQYFWLSKDCYDFFPALTIRNERGHKATYSCLVRMNYVDMGLVDDNCRVTFEAENNVDFRLGTGPLRYTRVVSSGDVAAITRVGESSYEMRFYRQGTAMHTTLLPAAVHMIGHQGKRYGYLSNAEFAAIAGIH